MRAVTVLVLLPFVLAAGCEKKVTAPKDLVVTRIMMNSSALHLEWTGGFVETGEGPQPLSSVGATLELRFSDAPPEGMEPEQLLAWYQLSWAVTGLPPEGEPGSQASLHLEDDRITGGRTYYFVVLARTGPEPEQVTFDAETGIGTGTPPIDAEPPAAIEDAEMLAWFQGAQIGWSAPGDDGLLGMAREYDLRYSTQHPESDLEAWFEDATPVGGEPIPSPAGDPEMFTLGGLSSGTNYYVAIRARDEAGQWGEITGPGLLSLETPPDVDGDGEGGLESTLGKSCSASGSTAFTVLLLAVIGMIVAANGRVDGPPAP